MSGLALPVPLGLIVLATLCGWLEGGQVSPQLRTPQVKSAPNQPVVLFLDFWVGGKRGDGYQGPRPKYDWVYRKIIISTFDVHGFYALMKTWEIISFQSARSDCVDSMTMTIDRCEVCVWVFFFLMWTILKLFIEFVTILLLFYVFPFFSLKACGILAPWPGIKLHLLHWKVKSSPLDHQGNPCVWSSRHP